MNVINSFEQDSRFELDLGNPENFYKLSPSLDWVTYTKDLGFPAEKLIIGESESLKNRKLVPFLANLDDEEYLRLLMEEDSYKQANIDWKEMSPICDKVVGVGLGMIFGGALLADAMKSKVGRVLTSCSFLAGSVAWGGGLFVATQYICRTGFKEIAEARLRRLNEKVQVIQSRILSLDDSSNNVEEAEQLKFALDYVSETCQHWNGRVIRDPRLPLNSYLVVKFNGT